MIFIKKDVKVLTSLEIMFLKKYNLFKLKLEDQRKIKI